MIFFFPMNIQISLTSQSKQKGWRSSVQTRSEPRTEALACPAAIMTVRHVTSPLKYNRKRKAHLELKKTLVHQVSGWIYLIRKWRLRYHLQTPCGSTAALVHITMSPIVDFRKRSASMLTLTFLHIAKNGRSRVLYLKRYVEINVFWRMELTVSRLWTDIQN